MVLSAWAMTIKLPMRSACGRTFVGIHVIAGPILIFLFSEASKTPALLAWIPVFWFACVTNALTLSLKSRREFVPDDDPGDCWLAKKVFFFIKSDQGLRNAEILLSTVIGGIWSVACDCPAILNYFLLGSFAMAATLLWARFEQHRFVMASRRAAVVQQTLAQRLKRRI